MTSTPISPDLDARALEIARRFTLDTELKRRAELQCAIVDALQVVGPSASKEASAHAMLHICYTSGQITEAEWQQHLADDEALRAWVEAGCRTRQTAPVAATGDERAAFEADCRRRLSKGGLLERDGEDAYVHQITRARWDAWQARAALQAQASAPGGPNDLTAENARLREALQFYAEGGHFGLSDEGSWDTVSGEPQNYWCDEAGTATIEDGTFAKLALAAAPTPPAAVQEQAAPSDADILATLRPLYADDESAKMGAADDLRTARSLLARHGAQPASSAPAHIERLISAYGYANRHPEDADGIARAYRALVDAIGAQPAADDAMERVLAELVDKIMPGLDTGDLVADAATASKALDRAQPATTPEPVAVALQEPVTRYCPGCGHVGPVESKYHDCCPDGAQARMIPKALAEKCRDTFKIAIREMLADQASGQAQDALTLHHYGDVLRPFVQIMADELLANAGKGDRPGWLSSTPQALMLEIYYHAAKLQKALKDGDSSGIREYAADTANLSMMVLDVCGGIDAARQESKGGEGK